MDKQKIMLSDEELRMLKNFRYNRLFNTKPNLKNKIFLDLRRDDWTNYLLNDVNSQDELNTGLSKWTIEDIEGATKFTHTMNKSNMTG